MKNRIVASLALPDTKMCLEALGRLVPDIEMAEICLDRMASFDLAQLISNAPCPLIISCRPLREGGYFNRSEAERLDILTEAMDFECAYVDIEWDSVIALSQRRHTYTQIIASRHWMDHVPSELLPAYEVLREQASVVKLVGMAQHPINVLPVFDFLKQATTPVIGLAMGEAGRLTRILAPCFAHCLLTYAAPSSGKGTASGQFSVTEMFDLYHLQSVGPHTAIHLHLCASTESEHIVTEQNSTVIHGEVVHIPLVVSHEDVREIISGLEACLPRLNITIDTLLVDGI